MKKCLTEKNYRKKKLKIIHLNTRTHTPLNIHNLRKFLFKNNQKIINIYKFSKSIFLKYFHF